MAMLPNGAVQDCTWVLCFLTRAAMQYCDQNGAVQRDVTGVLRWVLTAINVLYIAVTLTPFKFICRYLTVNYGYNDGVFS